MPESAQVIRSEAPVSEDVDLLRANTYGLLATLLGAPPDPGLIEELAGMPVDYHADSEGMNRAWSTLQLAAQRVVAGNLEHEYFALFIGIGRGELAPYASWYLTGFLMEKPLAHLRADLRALGFTRQEGVVEPEDHAAPLCEMMSMIIRDPDIEFATARKFFNDHLEPWMGRLFQDMQSAQCANFYRAVGELGEQFIDLERRYLSMLV